MYRDSNNVTILLVCKHFKKRKHSQSISFSLNSLVGALLYYLQIFCRRSKLKVLWNQFVGEGTLDRLTVHRVASSHHIARIQTASYFVDFPITNLHRTTVSSHSQFLSRENLSCSPKREQGLIDIEEEMGEKYEK